MSFKQLGSFRGKASPIFLQTRVSIFSWHMGDLDKVLLLPTEDSTTVKEKCFFPSKTLKVVFKNADIV